MSFANWGHYKLITLETTATQTDYQLCFTVNRSSGTDSEYTLYVDTGCNENYSDIRFSSDDESTTYSYFVEPGYTSSSAKIWVKIPSLSDGSKLRMHYGNTSAVSAASGSNTFNQYVENQTSTYNLSGACAYAAKCVGHVTLTSETFDVLVGVKGTVYNMFTGSTPEYRHTTWTDIEGYHDSATYSVKWVYPASHSFSILVTNDDMDAYQDYTNIRHVDNGIGSSGTDIGMQAYTLTGARVDWAGLAKYATQVQSPSEIITIDKVIIFNGIDFEPISIMNYSNEVDIETQLPVISTNKLMSAGYRPSGYYQYRKITLTNSASTSFDDFQLIFNIHRATGTDSNFDIYLDTDVKEDYSDIVFTDVNGKTEISHYIINPYTSSVAKILVKIPHIDASSSRDIYIYFNNQTAVSTSNKDTTVVPALTNSTCESISGWTRYQNLGYSNGYMNSFAIDGGFHPEGNYGILACAYSIWASNALVEFGQSATLDIGTPYKLFYDCRIGGVSSSTITVRVNDSVLKTYSYGTSFNYDKYAEYIQFTPTVESNKISWHVYTGTKSVNTCIRLDNVILIKDITSVSVSSYGTTEYCAYVVNSIEYDSYNTDYMSNIAQVDNIANIISTSTSTSTVSVRNGGFESGDFEDYDPDSYTYWTVCASASHSGSYGAQCNVTEAGIYTVLQRYINITEYETLGIWFRMPTCDISDYGEVQVNIQLLNTGYDYIDTLYNSTFLPGDDPLEWVHATCDVSLYSGTYIVYISVHSIGEGGGS